MARQSPIIAFVSFTVTIFQVTGAEGGGVADPLMVCSSKCVHISAIQYCSNYIIGEAMVKESHSSVWLVQRHQQVQSDGLVEFAPTVGSMWASPVVRVVVSRHRVRQCCPHSLFSRICIYHAASECPPIVCLRLTALAPINRPTPSPPSCDDFAAFHSAVPILFSAWLTQSSLLMVWSAL